MNKKAKDDYIRSTLKSSFFQKIIEKNNKKIIVDIERDKHSNSKIPITWKTFENIM